MGHHLDKAYPVGPDVIYYGLIHPDSELRFVSPEIGYGLFATRDIPRGTITWVGDPLDQILSEENYKALPAQLQSLAHKYSYLNGRGERILCWDHGRFVNHSCAAACLSPGFDFEIAVRDILAGEQITDDYGTLNLEESFECRCGESGCRGTVRPDDPLRHAEEWDTLIAAAFPLIADVAQPLWSLVNEKDEVKSILLAGGRPPSVFAHYRAHYRPVKIL